MKSKQQLQNGPHATLPDNSKIQATIKETLPLHSSLSSTALVYLNPNNESLLSINQLCDNGCIAIVEKSKLSILKNGEIILGHRNLTDGLWDVLFKQKRIHKINYIMSRDKNKTELAQYFHGCVFSPVMLKHKLD